MLISPKHTILSTADKITENAFTRTLSNADPEVRSVVENKKSKLLANNLKFNRLLPCSNLLTNEVNYGTETL